MIDDARLKQLVEMGCNITISASDESDLPLNSIEVGPANCRYKLYFKDFDELLIKINSAVDVMKHAEAEGLLGVKK